MRFTSPILRTTNRVQIDCRMGEAKRNPSFLGAVSRAPRTRAFRQWSEVTDKISPHAQRWLTAFLIGLPTLFILAAGPSWTWLLLVALVATAGLWEINGLLFEEPLPAKWRVLFFFGGLLLPFGAWLGDLPGLAVALALAVFSSFALLLVTTPLAAAALTRIALINFAWLYIPFTLSFVIAIGYLPLGRLWIIFTLLVVIAEDACAFYSGMRFGKTKLYEIISPKKSVEGAFGGLAAGVFLGLAYGFFALRGVSAFKLAGIAILLCIAGQTGDLIESMIKRNSGKKDSSHLLPGHGGMLDRLDSLLFAFPLSYFLLKWFV